MSHISGSGLAVLRCSFAMQHTLGTIWLCYTTGLIRGSTNFHFAKKLSKKIKDVMMPDEHVEQPGSVGYGGRQLMMMLYNTIPSFSYPSERAYFHFLDQQIYHTLSMHSVQYMGVDNEYCKCKYFQYYCQHHPRTMKLASSNLRFVLIYLDSNVNITHFTVIHQHLHLCHHHRGFAEAADTSEHRPRNSLPCGYQYVSYFYKDATHTTTH